VVEDLLACRLVDGGGVLWWRLQVEVLHFGPLGRSGCCHVSGIKSRSLQAGRWSRLELVPTPDERSCDGILPGASKTSSPLRLDTWNTAQNRHGCQYLPNSDISRRRIHRNVRSAHAFGHRPYCHLDDCRGDQEGHGIRVSLAASYFHLPQAYSPVGSNIGLPGHGVQTARLGERMSAD
jgi:hypothetical protein